MAYKMHTVEPVEFGDLKVTPEVTSELRLKLKRLEIDEYNLEEAKDLLARCFGEASAEVRKKMNAIPFVSEYQMLQVYLLEGENGIKRAERLLDEQSSKALNSIVEGMRPTVNTISENPDA